MSRSISTLAYRPALDSILGEVLCISNDSRELEKICVEQNIHFSFSNNIKQVRSKMKTGSKPDLVLFELNQKTAQEFTQLRHFMLSNAELSKIPFVVLSPYPSNKWRNLVKKFKATDYFLLPLVNQHFRERLEVLTNQNTIEPNSSIDVSWKIPFWKRSMDILGAGALILLLSPVLLAIALLIRLESKGPVVYVSKRAGQGFRVFSFLKFRSMRLDADQLIDDLKAENQYDSPSSSSSKSDVLQSKPLDVTKTVLVKDNGYVFEEKELINNSDNTFFKMKDDPRVTRVGKFIRNTSLDELPQLFNVLFGELSLVGNRPLPLYEAEQLTTDEYVLRFAAPAGITGLWQVSKRGKEDMSEEERKQLDIKYALEYDFWMDIKILWKTLPASIQSENV